MNARLAYRIAQRNAAMKWSREHLMEASLLADALTQDGILDQGAYIAAASHMAGVPGFIAWRIKQAVESGSDALATLPRARKGVHTSQ